MGSSSNCSSSSPGEAGAVGQSPRPLFEEETESKKQLVFPFWSMAGAGAAFLLHLLQTRMTPIWGRLGKHLPTAQFPVPRRSSAPGKCKSICSPRRNSLMSDLCWEPLFLFQENLCECLYAYDFYRVVECSSLLPAHLQVSPEECKKQGSSHVGANWEDFHRGIMYPSC